MVRSVWPAAETWPGNLMSIINAYNTLQHLLVILHRNIQKMLGTTIIFKFYNVIYNY
jgi:hypothetical protein